MVQIADPRAFNFDGEFNIANRGVVEFIEVLKLRCCIPLRFTWSKSGAIN